MNCRDVWRNACCGKQNIPAIILASFMIVVYTSLGIIGLVVKGPACGIGSTVAINYWIEIAGICYCVAAGIFVLVLFGIFFDWLWSYTILPWATQVGLFILTVIGTVTLSTSTDCVLTSKDVWSVAMAQVIMYFISILLFAVGFVVACNAA